MKTALASLPPLRDVIARASMDARKSLGQHFLLDLNLTAKIARAAGDLSETGVIEVGPGPGGLTRAILMETPRELIAVERDWRCHEVLGSLVEASQGHLRLIEADALETDLASLCPAPRAIIANLPYNIATPLLIAWLRQTPAFSVMILMFQAEVARRLVAAPRSKDYGRLSVLTQWLMNAECLFELPPRAFTPPPKVTSAVVRLTPRNEEAVDQALFSAMEKVTAAAFGQRRKMLRSSLKTLFPDTEKTLEAIGIAPTARAEEIGWEGFRTLALLVRNAHSHP
ncbi:MAG TPA: 16S rRNA (adenine(1518)-N(6)/adenine(1519)-N(6))-dimethyltransferase [Rhodospirillaceae bacterium]|nr:16S rRNA (adenine(1518)-N(6)/adenine(1519)-N(6))-dimethyltransferase [Rhodospirillaceae bacterium]